MMTRLLFLLFLLVFLTRCSEQKVKPHFVQVSSDYLTKEFDFSNKDIIDTLIRTKQYEFYYAAYLFGWDADNYYFLKKGNKLYQLEPDDEIGNGFKELQVINDSTLVFYTQFWNRVFGDFWVIKAGKSIDIKIDPGIISNTTVNDLVYNNGRLQAIGNIHVNIDSAGLKKLSNKLYELKNDSLREVCDFADLKTDIPKLNDGVYYFSYPGRHLSDTLHLNRLK